MNKHSYNSSYHSFQYIELNEIDSTNQSIQQYIKPYYQSDTPTTKIKASFPYSLFEDLILTPQIKKRLVIISIFTLLICINNNFGLLLPSERSLDLQCIIDTVFNLTSSLNNYFHYNLESRYILTTVSSLLIDFIYCYSLIDWALNYSGLRLVLSWALFYIVRGIIQVKIYFQ